MLISYVDGVYVFSAFGGFAMATLDTSVTPAQVLLARRIRRQLPGSEPLQLADVLRSGEPRRWVRAGPGSCEFTKDLKLSFKPLNQQTKPNDRKHRQ